MKYGEHYWTSSQRLDQIEQKVKTLGSSVGAIGDCQSTVAVFAKKRTDVQSKYVDLETGGCWNNSCHSWCCGISRWNQRVTLPRGTEGIFLNPFGVWISTMEQIYRIEVKRQNRNRPVIVKLYGYQKKCQSWEVASCLKGPTSVRIFLFVQGKSGRSCRKVHLLWAKMVEIFFLSIIRFV